MQEQRDAGLAKVTVDSSLMYPATSRRFLMSLWEMEGLRIELVPRTVKEMYGFVQDSEWAHWRAALIKEGQRTGRTWSPQETRAIAQAAANASAQWVNEELGHGEIPPRNDSMMRLVALSDTQASVAAMIADAIPRFCFKGPSKDEHRGDREIIAQSVVTGFKIIASDNRSSIRRKQMNGWLSEKELAKEEFVLNADDAIERAGQWREQPARMLEAALRAALPETPRSAEREDYIVTTFIRRMGTQGLKNVAEECLEEWNGERQREIYDRARTAIGEPPTPARETEKRRVQRTRDAAAGAGWER